MPSIGSALQTLPRAGYFINIGNIIPTATTASFYQNNGTDSVPALSTNQYALSSGTSTLLSTAGRAIFRDHGKTLVSSGRVFRKVQLITNNTATNGVAGTDAGLAPYITGYIELPGNELPSGAGIATGLTANQTFAVITPVARLG